MKDNERAAIYRLHASFCKTLADANRLLLINELAGGELPVGELCRRLGLAQPNVSKHLAIMRERGLVAARRDGVNIYYSLSDPRISEAIRLLKAAQSDQLEKQRALSHPPVVETKMNNKENEGGKDAFNQISMRRLWREI